MTDLKLLRIIASMDPAGGGPSEGIRQVSQHLLTLGVQSEVLSLDDPRAPWLPTQPVKIHALGPGMGGYGYAPGFKGWLREHARDYDAIIISGIWQYHSIAARNTLVELGMPYLIFTHGMLDPWFRHTYPLKHLKKSLYWPFADYRVLRDAHAVLFTSEEERLLARQSFRQYRANEVVVNYGTSIPPQNSDELREQFLRKFPSLREKRLMTFLSRIHEKKGCDLLISAFAKIAASDPRLHLLMVGPDQTGWVAHLKAQAQQLGIADRITWTGMLQGEDKWGALYASEVFVLPSHQENFGIAVAEAMGCGLPVLISDKVNIWREIKADGAGLVAADSVPGTEMLLSTWIAMSQSDQQRMAGRSRDSFMKRYTIAATATSIVDNIEAMRSAGHRLAKYG
jgi:glycosyltransferase involved in cell wall biosynthesis